MGKQFGLKRGLKRHKTGAKFERRTTISKKKKGFKDEVTCSPSPTLSGEPSGEESSGGAPEQINYKEPTMYDKLLTKLRSSNKTVANAYAKRQVAEDDETDGTESLSVSEEENGDDETDNDSLGMQGPEMVGTEELTEDAETEDDLETSDSDQDDDLSVHGASGLGTSSFKKHVEYKLSEEEAEDLSKKKWKYTWEVPSADISNCKWVGTGEDFLKEADMNSNYDLKQKLYKHWLDVYRKSGGNDFYSSSQRWFFSLCKIKFNFSNVSFMLSNSSFNDKGGVCGVAIVIGIYCTVRRNPSITKVLKKTLILWMAILCILCVLVLPFAALNHIFKTRDLVRKNDAKISKHQETTKEEMLPGDGHLDQGFTRPKVLILLPLRSIALRVIERLIQLTPASSKVNVEHLDRFYQDFGSEEIEGDEEQEEQLKNAKAQKPPKPSDHQSLFKGDTRDDFMIGIKFTRKTIKLYGDFYSSDIIVASPIELMTGDVNDQQ
ncbi:putative Digestive organ expansion factor [Corchorus olitorius]|uniref:Digestive organ expansion factor n=1 Tax=Corchorus olitorius TaxID=93759 RepID=A0A1R3I2G2_9ROSI|nr:putative Digestive organ expansion factor [Corchorus olitorius]